MKKTISILLCVLLLSALVFTACAKATPDPNYNYRVTGNFADWGSNYEERFMMTPVAKNDARLKPIAKALKDAQYVYIYEHTPPSGAAGWTVDYPALGISVDGNLAIKLIRLAPDSSDRSGWGHDAWMPSTEAPNFRPSLSPDTLYVPMDRSDEAAAAAGDGLGSVNGNPALLKGATTYYIVFAYFKDRTRGLGAVVK